MDQLKTIVDVAQLPATVLLVIAVYFLWRDNIRLQEEAKLDRAAMLQLLLSVYNRVLKVQGQLGMDDPPTLPKRPEQ